MDIKVSERIKAVGMFLDTERCICVADIGCDHGYTSIIIAQMSENINVIACDIGHKPLSVAKANIRKLGLENRIEARLGNGLSAILPGEADCAVMSGMGGLLIIEILTEGKKIADELKQLVLQPQRDIYEVRKYLHTNGFVIEDEDMIFEDSKYYTLIRAVRGTENYDNEYEYIYGKKLIEKKSAVLISYIEQMLQKEKNIIDSLKKGTAEVSKKRLTELTIMNNSTLEVYKCLQ